MRVVKSTVYLLLLKAINGQTCEVGSPGCCDTMVPPSYIPPNTSSCWQWWIPPTIITRAMTEPQKGCDYSPCQNAVCGCDSYCCETAWDLSCRGQTLSEGDTLEYNYFSNQCSAMNLCCEPETAYPKSPVFARTKPVSYGSSLPIEQYVASSTSCTPGVDKNCCATMIPPSFLAPDDSTCWQWWTPPAEGIPTSDMTPPTKGCDYKPCQDAVCACDPYCCDTAWDLSCRGYEMHSGDTVENNYFVSGCSAKILCCEQESAYPDPPQPAQSPVPVQAPIVPLPLPVIISPSSSSSSSSSSSTVNIVLPDGSTAIVSSPGKVTQVIGTVGIPTASVATVGDGVNLVVTGTDQTSSTIGSGSSTIGSTIGSSSSTIGSTIGSGSSTIGSTIGTGGTNLLVTSNVISEKTSTIGQTGSIAVGVTETTESTISSKGKSEGIKGKSGAKGKSEGVKGKSGAKGKSEGVKGKSGYKGKSEGKQGKSGYKGKSEGKQGKSGYKGSAGP